MLEILNPIIQPVLLILTPVLAAAITAWVVRAIQSARADLNQSQLESLKLLANTAVWAAEQASRSNVIPKKYRMDYAIKFVQSQADARGIKINVDELTRYIEAAVGEQLNAQKISG